MPEDVMSKLGKAREELSGMGNDDLAKSFEEIEKSFRCSGTAAVFLSGVIRDLTKDGSKLSTRANDLVWAFRLFKNSIDSAKKSVSSLSESRDFDKIKASVHGVVKEVASLSKELSKASKIEFKSIPAGTVSPVLGKNGLSQGGSKQLSGANFSGGHAASSDGRRSVEGGDWDDLMELLYTWDSDGFSRQKFSDGKGRDKTSANEHETELDGTQLVFSIQGVKNSLMENSDSVNKGFDKIIRAMEFVVNFNSSGVSEQNNFLADAIDDHGNFLDRVLTSKTNYLAGVLTGSASLIASKLSSSKMGAVNSTFSTGVVTPYSFAKGGKIGGVKELTSGVISGGPTTGDRILASTPSSKSVWILNKKQQIAMNALSKKFAGGGFAGDSLAWVNAGELVLTESEMRRKARELGFLSDDELFAELNNNRPAVKSKKDGIPAFASGGKSLKKRKTRKIGDLAPLAERFIRIDESKDFESRANKDSEARKFLVEKIKSADEGIAIASKDVDKIKDSDEKRRAQKVISEMKKSRDDLLTALEDFSEYSSTTDKALVESLKYFNERDLDFSDAESIAPKLSHLLSCIKEISKSISDVSGESIVWRDKIEAMRGFDRAKAASSGVTATSTPDSKVRKMAIESVGRVNKAIETLNTKKSYTTDKNEIDVIDYHIKKLESLSKAAVDKLSDTTTAGAISDEMLADILADLSSYSLNFSSVEVAAENLEEFSKKIKNGVRERKSNGYESMGLDFDSYLNTFRKEDAESGFTEPANKNSSVRKELIRRINDTDSVISDVNEKINKTTDESAKKTLLSFREDIDRERKEIVGLLSNFGDSAISDEVIFSTMKSLGARGVKFDSADDAIENLKRLREKIEEVDDEFRSLGDIDDFDKKKFKTAKARAIFEKSVSKINDIKKDSSISIDDKNKKMKVEKARMKGAVSYDKAVSLGNEKDREKAETLIVSLETKETVSGAEALSDKLETLASDVSNSDHEIDNFNGLLEELEKKAKSARSEIDDIFGGVPTGALAGVAALLLLEKGIEKLTDMFSDAAVDIAKMRYELKKSEAAYKRMFAGNDLSSFARSLNMTNKELSELGGEFGEINNALIRSSTSFSTFSGMLQNVRDNIGKVDSGEIKKVAEILNSLNGAQVDVMINGVGNMDDAANMLMNLMNNDKLDVAIEMMAKGAFGDVESKDKLEMSEVDRKVIESQEYANKLLEDIRLYMFNMSSQMVPFVTGNLPYLGAMTKVLSSSAARTIASVIFLKNISSYAKGLNGTVWNRAVRTRDAAGTGGIESEGKKSWKGIATSAVLLAGGAYLYAKGSKEVAAERREWAKKTSVLDHGFGDEQAWGSDNDANNSRNIGKIMMGAAAGAETARLAASSAGLSEEMASLAAKFGLLAGAVSGAYSALKDTHVSADTEETHSVTVKMLEAYNKNYGEMLKKNRSELYQSMIAMRDFKNVLKALEGDISFSSSVLKKETAEALINNVAQGGGTSATGIQAYNDVVSSSVDIYSKTTEILNRSRLDVLKNEKISGAARSNLLNLSVQEQAKALNKFTQAVLSTAGKFAEIAGILKNIKMAGAQIDFNTLIGEAGVAGLVTSSSTDLYDEAGRNLSAASDSFAQELERLSSSFQAAEEANKGMIEQIKKLEKETASRKAFGLKSIVKEDGTIDDKALKGNNSILDAKQKEAEDSINRKAKAADKVGIAASILKANQSQTDMQELIKGLSSNDGKKGEGLEKNRELAQKSFDQLKDVFTSTGDKGSTKALEEALGDKDISTLGGEELHNLVKQMGEISTQNLIKLETNNQKFFQSIASERKSLDDIQRARAPQQIAANVVDTDALQANAYAETLGGLVKFQKDINSQADNLVNLMNKGGLESFYGKEAEYLDSVAEWALVNGRGVENAERALENTMARIENARSQRSKYKSELNAGVDKSVTNLKDNFSADSDALKPLDDSQKTAAIAYRDSQIKLQEAFKSGDVDAVTKAQKEAEEAADVMGSFIKSLGSGTVDEKKTAKKLEMLANAMAVGSTAAAKAFEGIRESELNEKSLALKQVQDIKKKVEVRESERAPEQELVDTMLDYANDIGLPFEKILELEAQTVNLARERLEDELTALQEMKDAGAGQLEIKRQEAQVAKTQAELSKKSLGAQRSAMDKMMGSILGTFSDFAGIAGDLNEAAVFGQGRVINSAGLAVGNVGKNGGWENRQFNAQSGSGSDSQYSPFNYGETKRKKVPGFANGGKVYDLSKEGTITGGPTTGDKMLARAPNKPVWILNKEQQVGFDSIDQFANGGSASGIVRVNAGERVVSVKDMIDRARAVGLSNDGDLFEKLSGGKSDSIDQFANGGSARGIRNWHGHGNTQTIDSEKERELLAIERVYGSVLRGGANEMVLAELSKEYNLILRDNPGLRESKRLQMSSLEKIAKSKLEEKHRKIEGQSIDIMSDMLAGRGKSVSTKQKMMSDGLNETPSAKSFISKTDIERAGLAENNGVVNPVATASAVTDNSVVGMPLIDTPEADKKFEKLRISESHNNPFSETAQAMRFLEASGISGKVTKQVDNVVGSGKDLAIEATKGIASKFGKLIKLKKATLPATEILSNVELMDKFTKAGGQVSDITGFIKSGRSVDDFMQIYNAAPNVADAVKVFSGGASSTAAKMIDGAKLAKLSKAGKFAKGVGTKATGIAKGVGTKATGIAKKVSVGKILGVAGAGLEVWRGADEFKRSDKGFVDWANLGLTGLDAADQLAGSRGKGGNLTTGMISLVAGMGVGATMSEEQIADFVENELVLKDASVATNLMRWWDRKSLVGKGVGAMVGLNVRMAKERSQLLSEKTERAKNSVLLVDKYTQKPTEDIGLMTAEEKEVYEQQLADFKSSGRHKSRVDQYLDMYGEANIGVFGNRLKIRPDVHKKAWEFAELSAKKSAIAAVKNFRNGIVKEVAPTELEEFSQVVNNEELIKFADSVKSEDDEAAFKIKGGDRSGIDFQMSTSNKHDLAKRYVLSHEDLSGEALDNRVKETLERYYKNATARSVIEEKQKIEKNELGAKEKSAVDAIKTNIEPAANDSIPAVGTNLGVVESDSSLRDFSKTLHTASYSKLDFSDFNQFLDYEKYYNAEETYKDKYKEFAYDYIKKYHSANNYTNDEFETKATELVERYRRNKASKLALANSKGKPSVSTFAEGGRIGAYGDVALRTGKEEYGQINVSGASKGIDDGVLVRVSNGKESIVKNEWLDNLTPYVMGGLGTTRMSNEDILRLAAGGRATTGGVIGRGGIKGFRNTGSPGRSKTSFGFDPITSADESSDTESILKDILRVNIEVKDIFAAAFGVGATADDGQKSKWESIKEASRKQAVAAQPTAATEDDYGSKIVKAVEESTIYICDSVRSISEGLKLIGTTAPQFGIAQSPVPSSADSGGEVQVVGEVEVKSNVTVKVVQDEGNLRTFVVKVVEESPAAIGRALLSGSKN